MAAVTYSVVITHEDNGDISCKVDDVQDSDSDRAAIAYGLRIAAADLVESGEPTKHHVLH